MNEPRGVIAIINAAWAWGFAYVQRSGQDLWIGWNEFWFTPRRPTWLGVLRIAAGCMALYTHAVWTIDFDVFLGPDRMIGPEIAPQMNPTNWHWTHFDLFESPTVLWSLHWVALGSFAAFTIGLGMPWTGWLAAAFAISYAHRATGALFGLDQMNVALVTYLTLGGAGRAWSVDQWWRNRRESSSARLASTSAFSVWSNIGTRLIQLQLCVIYWFAGTGKLQGVTWWNGEALWGAFASYQYQSIDMTWLHEYPSFLALATHLTIVWEISYVFLVWSHRTRPVVIGMAVLVHAGIAVFLGMMTFGTIMILANLAFVEWAGLFSEDESDRS